MEEFLAADPRTLRSIAHPVRSALLYELYARGEATATILAHAIDRPVNAVSFHLRELHRFGVIEEILDRDGDGRARWWRPSGERGLRFDEASLREQPGGPGALDVGMRYFEARWHALVERLFRRRDSTTSEVWCTSDVPMLLTDSEAEQMRAELLAVLERWNSHGRDAAGRVAAGNETRRTYLALSMLMPHPVDLIET